jgi:sensor histidine kinase YesM
LIRIDERLVHFDQIHGIVALVVYGGPMVFPKDRAPEAERRLDNIVVFASILGFWLFYVGIVTARAAILDFPMQGELLTRRLIVSGIGVLVTILLWQLVRLLDRRPLGMRIAAAMLLAVPAAISIAAINYYFFNIYEPIDLLDEKMPKDPSGLHYLKEIAELSISRYFFLVAWASFYLALTFAKDVGASERRAAEFAQAAQQAELRALRYQVNPHFLFNTLNSLSSLVITGRNKEAEAMIMNLSTFFRSSLSGDPTVDVPLEDEIALQRLYLDIEAIRFPKRLEVQIDLPAALRDWPVPGLILQPIVENAIKHGVARSTGTVTVAIEAMAMGDELRITISNDGAAGTTPDENGAGIGLSNVRSRLAARFGDAASMQVDRPDAAHFRVTLTLPRNSHA